MKKVIPFSKEISFQTKIAEITDIEVTHNLEKTPFNSIEGSFLVNGTYKMHEASQIEEKFSYDLPFTIEVDERYDLSDVKIKISDFFFEIVNDDILKVNVEIELSEVKEREEQPEQFVFDRCYEDEEDEEKVELEEEIPELEHIEEEVDIIEPIDILDSTIPKVLEVERPVSTVLSSSSNQQTSVSASPITDIFTTISNDEDTFKAYYVYIVRENDTLDEILNRYQISREEAAEYNNLNEIKIGTKLILPCPSHE